MAQTLREFMTDNPCEVDPDTTLVDVAKTMRDNNIGDVVVVSDGQLRGILTDRDIVVRALAEGLSPDSTTVDAIFSGQPVSCPPDTSVDDAVSLMRERAIRRLPVVEDGRAIGIVSLGDLAMYDRDKDALADISAAPPNA